MANKVDTKHYDEKARTMRLNCLAKQQLSNRFKLIYNDFKMLMVVIDIISLEWKQLYYYF